MDDVEKNELLKNNIVCRVNGNDYFVMTKKGTGELNFKMGDEDYSFVLVDPDEENATKTIFRYNQEIKALGYYIPIIIYGYSLSMGDNICYSYFYKLNDGKFNLISEISQAAKRDELLITVDFLFCEGSGYFFRRYQKRYESGMAYNYHNYFAFSKSGLKWESYFFPQPDLTYYYDNGYKENIRMYEKEVKFLNANKKLYCIIRCYPTSLNEWHPSYVAIGVIDDYMQQPRWIKIYRNVVDIRSLRVFSVKDKILIGLNLDSGNKFDTILMYDVITEELIRLDGITNVKYMKNHFHVIINYFHYITDDFKSFTKTEDQYDGIIEFYEFTIKKKEKYSSFFSLFKNDNFIFEIRTVMYLGDYSAAESLENFLRTTIFDPLTDYYYFYKEENISSNTTDGFIFRTKDFIIIEKLFRIGCWTNMVIVNNLIKYSSDIKYFQ